MSWLRSAVSKAVEVGGKNNLTHTVRNYADTVGHAVAEGAKILQDRMAPRGYKSFKQTVKRLEEAAVTCRGLERIQLLRRWLVALKEIERHFGPNADNSEDLNNSEDAKASLISELEKQRDVLEAQLKKVNTSLSAALARLHNTREEREQFEEASNQTVSLLKSKEDELLKSIASCKIESAVVKTWINFLEDSWILQSQYTEKKDKETIDELAKCGNYFAGIITDHLAAYKEQLGPHISHIRKLVENLKNMSDSSETVSNPDGEILNQRKIFEEEYLQTEAKIVTMFSVVDTMKQLFYGENGNNIRRDDHKIKELFDDIQHSREEFDSIERPNLEIEIPSPKRDTSPVLSPRSPTTATATTGSPRPKSAKSQVPPPITSDQNLDPAVELAKLESEFGGLTKDYSTEEIGGWEFDELEKELTSGKSGETK